MFKHKIDLKIDPVLMLMFWYNMNSITKVMHVKIIIIQSYVYSKDIVEETSI